jgi:hypothetical protein
LYLFYLLLTCSTVVDWFYLFMPGVLFVAKILWRSNRGGDGFPIFVCATRGL